MAVLFQVICTGIICTMGINMGLIFAWPAATITLFASENTTLNRPMTETEISLLGSLSSIGALISTLIAGFLMEQFGRKKCTIIISLSLVIFWVLLIAVRTVEVVLVSVFISGMSSAAYLIATVYISEICQESIRGGMTSANLVSYSFGMLLSYGLGGCLSYDVMLYVGMSMTIGGTCVLFTLKDSPIYLLQNGKEKVAVEAIAFFRSMKTTDKAIAEEISVMKRSLHPDLDASTPDYEYLNPDSKPPKKFSCWQFVKKSQSTRRALLLCFVVVTASIFQGFVVVQMYVEPLFMEALPSVSPTVCSVVMATIGAVAGVVAAYLTDAAGRRPLMIYSSFGAGISCLILATQMHLHWGPGWITAVFAYTFCIAYTCGAGIVPFVLLAEVFLPEILQIGSSSLVGICLASLGYLLQNRIAPPWVTVVLIMIFCFFFLVGPGSVPYVLLAEVFVPEVLNQASMCLMEWICLMNFFAIAIFPYITDFFGMHGAFYGFAFISLANATISYLIMPETAGKSNEEIQKLFLPRRQK